MPNQAPNPSFEVDLSGWEHASGTAPTMSRVSTGTPFHGSWSMQVTANATANVTVRTPPSGTLGPTVAPGDVWSVGAYGLWVTGTPKSFRCDIRWMQNATTESTVNAGVNGSSQAMNTSTWAQSKIENQTAPSDAVSLRIRIVCLSATSSDVFRLDGIQMEKAASLPAFDTGSLGVPQNLNATAISSSEIDLTWDAVSGATGYDIERNSSIIVSSHGTNSYDDTGLTANTEYTYRVRSVG